MMLFCTMPSGSLLRVASLEENSALVVAVDPLDGTVTPM